MLMFAACDQGMRFSNMLHVVAWNSAEQWKPCRLLFIKGHYTLQEMGHDVLSRRPFW